MTATYLISGMTCGHCVASVTEEVSEIHGVTDVDVDLAAGRMVVSGPSLEDAAVREAVAEAGYSAERAA